MGKMHPVVTPQAFKTEKSHKGKTDLDLHYYYLKIYFTKEEQTPGVHFNISSSKIL